MIYHLLIESDNICSNIVQLVLSVLLLLVCGFSFLFLAVQDSSITDIVCLSVGRSVGAK